MDGHSPFMARHFRIKLPIQSVGDEKSADLTTDLFGQKTWRNHGDVNIDNIVNMGNDTVTMMITGLI